MNILRVIPGEYRDSLFLMKLSNDVSRWPGIKQAVIVMGTESNRKILNQVGFGSTETISATSNDLIIAIELEGRHQANDIFTKLDTLLSQIEPNETTKNVPADLTAALIGNPEIDLVSISTPGEIAVSHVKQALQAGKHVFCFSHHISIESEIELKDLAIQKQLFMMGPDCGTSIIDGVGLGFANHVRKGSIGLVSASGSGLQEVVSLIDRSGAGISQAIGVGGRDLTSPIDGRMAEQALLRIANLPETRVIILLAKKISVAAEQRLIKTISKINLPIITQLKGFTLETERVGNQPIFICDTYEDCAKYAVLLSGEKWVIPDRTALATKWVEKIVPNLNPERQFLRGLFAGGSLCAETHRILTNAGFKIHSNLNHPIEPSANAHILLDLGAEEYTEGRAHPFIDHRLRALEIEKAFSDPSVGFLLVDVVLGYGCHPDPAGELINSINKAKEKHGRGPAVIASVCGTSEDIQNYKDQRGKLEEQDVFVAESNAAAAILGRDLLIQRMSMRNLDEIGLTIDDSLINRPMNIANVGLPTFAEGPQKDGARVIQVGWKPEPKVSSEIKSLLDGLL